MKDTASKIPQEFWTTETGRNLCTAIHYSGWEGLDCLNEGIEAMTAAIDATPEGPIKAEIERARAKVIAAREACREAMAILSDTTL